MIQKHYVPHFMLSATWSNLGYSFVAVEGKPRFLACTKIAASKQAGEGVF
jgi:hypothetical protein